MRLAAGVVLVGLGLLLVVPVATVRVEQQVERGQMVARLGTGPVWDTIEVKAPDLVALDLAVTSRHRPAPAARVRLVEWPGGIERVRVPLPRRLPAPGGHEYTSIRFPALRDSADRTYRLAIERHGPPEEGTLAIWGRVSSAVGGAASVLAYRAWHRVTGWAALSTLGDRLRAALRGAPGVAAAGALVLAYGASLFCLLGLLRADPG